MSGLLNRIVSITLILLLLGLMSGQTPSSNALVEDNPMDDLRINSILWETIGLPEYMDPHKNYESAGGWIHANIYETLFTYPWDTADTTPSVPLLAESVEISSDGLNYTFYLRQNVKFHDGTTFNATAVQMNFWRMLGRGWDDSWGPVWMVAEPLLRGQAIEDAVYEFGDGSPQHIGNWTDWKMNSDAIISLDEFTVRIRLEYAFTPFLSVLAYSVCSMISPTFFMARGGMSPVSSDLTLDDEACGTGPYELVQWIDDDRIELTIFDDYWRATDAVLTHPNAGTMTDVTIKLNMDANNRILNLQNGTSDAGYWPTTHVYDIWNNVTTIGDGTLQSLHSDIKVWTGNPTYSVMFLGFNMNPYLNVSNELRLNPFTDYELRAAISYSFDYQALIDDVLNGLGIQLQGPIPQGMFAHDDDLFMFELDMVEAVTHWNLAMANGLDAIWANNSYELNIYMNEGSLNRNKAGLLVKQAIENIIAHPASTDPSSPLTINIIGLSWANYLFQVRNKQLPIFFLGWAPDYADPDNYVTPFVKSTGTFPKRVGLAGSFGEGGGVWDHETIDGWIDAAAAEIDPAIRISLYTQIQEAIVDHCAYLWCYQTVNFHVEHIEMFGYVYNPMRQPYFFHYTKGVHITILPDIPFTLLIGEVVFVTLIVIALVTIKKSSKD
ncbi:MAG: ABC transporter substrate-binding protein [Candidatus Thorarchaeota archaeon]|jgi:peptide/nickel transport system substrate-binding protein